MRTGNPTLTSKTFTDYKRVLSSEDTMSIQGTINKSFILLFLLLITAVFTWNQFFINQDPGAIVPYITGGAIAGFIMALITIFKKTWAPVTAPIYALLEGLFIGGISAYMESIYPGIVIQAIGLTFGTLFALLFAYKSRLIKVTENFKLGVVAATGGIFMIYLVTFILSFFGISMPYIHESGIIGIGFSLFVVIIAALNLVLDFDFIESGADQGAPKYMEWYAAFGLIVTLIWLYIEILRLLSKLQSRD